MRQDTYYEDDILQVPSPFPPQRVWVGGEEERCEGMEDISGEIVPHYLVMEVFPVPSASGVGGYYTWYVDASCHRDPYPHGEFHIRTGNTWSTIPLINVAGAFRTYGYG